MFRFQNSHITKSWANGKTSRTFGALLLGALVLTGCGKKGPLYLPEKPQTINDAPAQNESASQNASEAHKTESPSIPSTEPKQETP